MQYVNSFWPVNHQPGWKSSSPNKQSQTPVLLFSDSVIKPLGEVTLKVRHKDKQHNLKFQVVEGDSKPLLSAETCETLGLLKVNWEQKVQVNTIQENKLKTKLTKGKILIDFKDIFEGLRHIGKALTQK